jgi:HD-GYP domain-containing protein (c-di-GMP phosphodiesterase class II)
LAAINAKDAYTSSHSEGVAEYAMLLLEGMNINMSLEDKGIFRYVCTLHDIGKIGISMQIIRKKGKLTEAECNEVKEHPKIGASVLEPIEFLKKFTPMVLHHHEHFNGKGYPEGKKGEDIPLWARILTVADAYHAMRSDRPYRLAMSEEEAFEQLRIGTGSQFDPEVVKAALTVFKEAR